MADSAVFEPVRRSTAHLAVTARGNEPSPVREETEARTLALVHEVLRRPGAPLDTGTRNLMEQRLGADFCHVRVHADAPAAASARAVNALAYTVGHSIVFGAGLYAPDREDGRDRLAHELVHTIQQASGGPPGSGQRLGIESPTSPAEDEARTIAAASRSAGGQRAASAVPPAAIALQPGSGNVLNRAKNRASPQRSLAVADHAAVSRPVRSALIQRQVDATANLIHQGAVQVGAARPGMLAFVVRQFDAFMRALRVAYRFGGSLAARLQGGGRAPHDIDVEVANTERMQALATTLEAPDSGWTGTVHRDPRTGRVIMLNAWHRSHPDFVFDMVSEADPALRAPARVHEGMEIDEGGLGPTGGLVPSPELIINYLDRIDKKPDVAAGKGDRGQIRSLLVAAHAANTGAAWTYWDHEILPLLHEDVVHRLEQVFENVVGARPPEPMDVGPEPMDVG